MNNDNSMLHFITPPRDNEKTRMEFLERTKTFSDFMQQLRELKMEVYGLNWLHRGWDSTFQNLDRKFGIIEEILWGKIIKKRMKPSDQDIIHLADAFIDLGNYCLFARWLLETAYPECSGRLSSSILARTEVEADL